MDPRTRKNSPDVLYWPNGSRIHDQAIKQQDQKAIFRVTFQNYRIQYNRQLFTRKVLNIFRVGGSSLSISSVAKREFMLELKLKLKGALQHSPKPAPLPLNLEDAARSPALKKAMMENPQGEKHQIETLRNLRTVFISSFLIGRWTKPFKRVLIGGK